MGDPDKRAMMETTGNSAVRAGRNAPTVSIGLPVYNGGDHLRETLDSLLAQDYGDFELIITDNASTDDTSEIARRYASGDSRIRYHRNAENVGAIENFNVAFAMGRGKYFMWASCHDLWAPQFLSRCVETMEGDDEIALCFPRGVEIDMAGQTIGTLRGGPDTRGVKPTARYRAVVRKLCCYAVYGLHRTSVLRRLLPWQANRHGTDAVLLAEEAFYGTFAFIDEELFQLRRSAGSRDWTRYFRDMGLPCNAWSFLRIYGWMFQDYLTAIRRHAPSDTQVVTLGLATLAAMIWRSFLWAAGVMITKVFPRFYRPW